MAPSKAAEKAPAKAPAKKTTDAKKEKNVCYPVNTSSFFMIVPLGKHKFQAVSNTTCGSFRPMFYVYTLKVHGAHLNGLAELRRESCCCCLKVWYLSCFYTD
jgi:hypothetical protein